jgi:uncharacterized protein (DUF1778 family)
MPSVARSDLKLDPQDKDLLSRAATPVGTTMAGFVRSATKEKAQSLLDQESRVTLSERDFAAFNTAIVGAFTPNNALQKALASVAKVPRA